MEDDDAKFAGSLFPHALAIARNPLVRRIARYLRPVVYTLAAYGAGVVTTYLWREPKAWFDRVNQTLVDEALLKKHVAALVNSAEAQARATRIDRDQERAAIVAGMRMHVEYAAAHSRLPVQPVLSDYDQLVTNWLRSSPECSVQGGHCILPVDAARMALAVRHSQ